MKTRNAIKLAASILICQAAGGLGAIFTAPEISGWYSTLEKPCFNPPNWIFGPVWTILYFLMGIALYLVITSKKSKDRKIGLWLFGIQLALNSLWSIIFFGLHSPKYALVEIIILWAFIFATTIKFMKINKYAGYLFIPYITWVTFALFLNMSICQLN